MNVKSRIAIAVAFIGGGLALADWLRQEPPAPEPLCPAIQDVSHRPLGEKNFSGHAQRVHTDQFDDDFLSDRENKIKVGVREQWGGSLIFFGESGSGPGGNSTNTLDDSAVGRGLALVFHDDNRKGWSPHQSGNKCGKGSGVDGALVAPEMVFTVTPLLANPAWKRGELESVCADSNRNNLRSTLRVQESLRFVQSRILEIEYLVTNLGTQDVVAGEDEPNEIPNLFASSGRLGGHNLNVLKNARGEVVSGEKRTPAASALAGAAARSWASFQNAASDYGIGVYWESRNNRLRALESNGLSAGFPFTLPAKESARARFYLLLGGFGTVKSLAEDLDRTLPPFGRIDSNRIMDDARTVKISGWVLDNKDVAAVELWVDGKKVSDLPLGAKRDDVCAAYPGYLMCEKNHLKVGFETSYPRPNGSGCARPVEIRAKDSDGNWRVIARKSVSPVVY